MTTRSGNLQPGPDPSLPDRTNLELQLLQRQVEKLSIEIAAFRQQTWWDRMIGRFLPVATALVAVGGFWFGIYQYQVQKSADERKQRDDSEKAEIARAQELADAQRSRARELQREAASSFWQTQLQLYLKAAEATATIATTNDDEARKKAEADFWILYWGPLSCVEDVSMSSKAVPQVERAMVQFGKYLLESGDQRTREELQARSLKLAHAIRTEIPLSQGLEATPLD